MTNPLRHEHFLISLESRGDIDLDCTRDTIHLALERHIPVVSVRHSPKYPIPRVIRTLIEHLPKTSGIRQGFEAGRRNRPITAHPKRHKAWVKLWLQGWEMAFIQFRRKT